MRQIKRIFIVGHPGTGKALLANTLAKRLGWQYVDADFGLEFQIGRTMPETLGAKGQDAFYDCQLEVLSQQLNNENLIINTDSSVVCAEKIIHLLKDQCVVYLKVSTLVQIERLARSPKPLLATDINKFLTQLHEERDAWYEKVASFSIDTSDSDLDKHVSEIVNFILPAGDVTQNLKNVISEEKKLTLYHKILHTPVHLTEQQTICLKLLAEGKGSKEIAKHMKLSWRTVEGHVANIMKLLGCSSSKELVALYHYRP